MKIEEDPNEHNDQSNSRNDDEVAEESKNSGSPFENIDHALPSIARKEFKNYYLIAGFISLLLF